MVPFLTLQDASFHKFCIQEKKNLFLHLDLDVGVILIFEMASFLSILISMGLRPEVVIVAVRFVVTWSIWHFIGVGTLVLTFLLFSSLVKLSFLHPLLGSCGIRYS